MNNYDFIDDLILRLLGIMVNFFTGRLLIVTLLIEVISLDLESRTMEKNDTVSLARIIMVAPKGELTKLREHLRLLWKLSEA